MRVMGFDIVMEMDDAWNESSRDAQASDVDLASDQTHYLH